MLSRLLSGLTLLLFLEACDSKKDVEQLRRQLADRDAQIEELRSKLEKMEIAVRLSMKTTMASVSPAPTAGSSSASHSTTPAAATQEPPPMIGAQALLRAYAANEVAGDEQFKGKPLLLIGHVQKVIKSLGHPFVEMGSVTSSKRVNCRFDDDSKDPGTFRQGQLLILDCVGAGTSVLRTPIVEHCRLAEPADVAPQYPGLIVRDPKKPGVYTLGGAIKEELR